MSPRSSNRDRADYDERDDQNEVRDEVSYPAADDDASSEETPPKKASSLPWFLLVVVMLFSGAAGYLGYTKLMEQQEANEALKKARDEALASVKDMSAKLNGANAAQDNLQKQIGELQGQLKELKDKQTAAADPAEGENAVATAKGKSSSSKSTKSASSKTSTSSKKKKSSRR